MKRHILIRLGIPIIVLLIFIIIAFIIGKSKSLQYFLAIFGVMFLIAYYMGLIVECIFLGIGREFNKILVNIIILIIYTLIIRYTLA